MMSRRGCSRRKVKTGTTCHGSVRTSVGMEGALRCGAILFDASASVSPTLLGVTVIVFILLHLAPGDPINAMVPPDAPVELVQMIRQQMGLDQPLPIQYWRWLSRVARGDLGNSLATRRPVLQESVPPSGTRFCWLFPRHVSVLRWGIALGTTAAFFRGRWLDKVVSAMAITGVSLPPTGSPLCSS